MEGPKRNREGNTWNWERCCPLLTTVNAALPREWRGRRDIAEGGDTLAGTDGTDEKRQASPSGLEVSLCVGSGSTEHKKGFPVFVMIFP